MFDRLKQWTLRALDCVPMSGRCSPIPRVTNYAAAPLVKQGEACSCHNCLVLEEVVGECPICLESFTGLCMCESCSNPTCPKCASRLSSCPFCRHPRAPAPQPAMDKLLSRLRLPTARPTNWDIATITAGRSEEKGEVCPVDENCPWVGGDAGSHLETDHRMSLLEGSSLTLEIGGFRRKARSSRSYSVALRCHSRVFVARVSLRPGRLTLSVSATGPPPPHAAWLEVASTSRTVKAILPVARINGKQKRLQVSSDSLISPWRHGSDDTVRISVTIRSTS